MPILIKIIWQYTSFPLKILVDYFFPNICLNCTQLIQSCLPGRICGDCWAKINFVSLPICQKCGQALPYDYQSSIICLKCHYSKPSYSLARALCVFDVNSKQLIHHFKYYSNYSIAIMFAQLLYSRYRKDILLAEYIVPVPIHRIKLILRGYNQAQVLGRYLAQIANLPIKSNMLIKNKWTQSQTTLNRRDRTQNVNDSIIINKPELVKDKNIILIDDVITTGTTINLCSKLLMRAGAKNVFVLCIAYS